LKTKEVDIIDRCNLTIFFEEGYEDLPQFLAENKVIPDRSLVLGSPGKVVRQVTDEEIQHIKENARDYVENIKKYKK